MGQGNALQGALVGQGPWMWTEVKDPVKPPVMVMAVKEVLFAPAAGLKVTLKAAVAHA